MILLLWELHLFYLWECVLVETKKCNAVKHAYIAAHDALIIQMYFIRTSIVVIVIFVWIWLLLIVYVHKSCSQFQPMWFLRHTLDRIECNANFTSFIDTPTVLSKVTHLKYDSRVFHFWQRYILATKLTISGPPLLTWNNFDLNMDKLLHPFYRITYPFPNFSGAVFKVWICNIISHFTGHVVTYHCGD